MDVAVFFHMVLSVLGHVSTQMFAINFAQLPDGGQAVARQNNGAGSPHLGVLHCFGGVWCICIDQSRIKHDKAMISQTLKNNMSFKHNLKSNTDQVFFSNIFSLKFLTSIQSTSLLDSPHSQATVQKQPYRAFELQLCSVWGPEGASMGMDKSVFTGLCWDTWNMLKHGEHRVSMGIYANYWDILYIYIKHYQILSVYHNLCKIWSALVGHSGALNKNVEEMGWLRR